MTRFDKDALRDFLDDMIDGDKETAMAVAGFIVGNVVHAIKNDPTMLCSYALSLQDVAEQILKTAELVVTLDEIKNQQ